MGITQNEKETMIKIAEKIKGINDFFRENGTVPPNSSVPDMYSYMGKLKRIMGNFDNDMSYIGCQMAKEYLCKQHEFDSFDVSLKSQSAPGLDVDEMTVKNERVVGEIKTTYPYGKFDLGAQQKASFRKDFKKLQDAQADFKYFFVTENRTYDIIATKYMDELRDVKVVLLPQALDSDNEQIETPKSQTSQTYIPLH
ncbi:hypothetical protein [Anoxynatronum buryatiense]|uniref:Uncharacterized protein n=1 Tax=Anoxynatronum buryatiense TaxID=489973 RepID=A0AA46AKS1_9CLOT|nr:hypothetical protein [Anoxynatronum buryatiense]SMP72464.1 hypothetical protein SAMN06296020_1295 [Anoxynatronum buryatiense]